MKEKNNIPKGYKPSALGSIPEDWDCVPLKATGKIGTGSTPDTENKSYWVDGDIPWLRTGKVNDGTITNCETFITKKALEEKSIELLPENSLLIAMVGQGQTRGRVALLKIRAWVNQNFAYLIPNSKVDPFFLYFVLKSSYDRIRYEGNRGGNQGSLNGQIVKSLKVILPQLREQTAIANLLGTWDKAINTLTQLITQKELRKKYLMQQLLTGKKRLKGFRGEWVKYSYENLLKIVKRDFDWNENELYKLISVRRRSGGIFFREALYGHQILVKNLRTVNKGDFLFSKMQILHGASALVTKEFDGAKISGSYIAVVAKDKKVLSIEFFEWYSKTPHFYHQTYISSYGVHIEKMTFDFESFLTLDIRIPSVEEQNAISNVLQTADNELRLLREKLEQLKVQKMGLMQILLTGKKRLHIKR